MNIRRVPQEINDFKSRSFLSLQAVGVNRINQGYRIGFGELAGNSQALVKVPIHCHQSGPMHYRLRKFSGSNFPGRQDYRTFQTSLCRIGSGRSRSIAGRGTGHHFLPAREHLGNRHGHTAIFKRTGRVHSLDLDKYPRPYLVRQIIGVDQRSATFLQSDDFFFLAYGEPIAIFVDYSLPQMRHLASPPY